MHQLTRLTHRIPAVGRLGRMLWRRSLLLRVIASTVALGLVVVLVVGQLLLKRISDDLVDSARTRATNDAKLQTLQLVDTFRHRGFASADPDFTTWLPQQLSLLYGDQDNPLRYVALLKEQGTPAGSVTDQGKGLAVGSIPAELRNQLVAEQDKSTDLGRLYSVPFAVPLQDSHGVYHGQRAIAVGTLLDFGTLGAGRAENGNGIYELYLVYPLDREVQILANIQQSFLYGAAALLVLIGLVAWVLTRQVVAPVRQAVRTAEQLAAGHLDRRMPVRGEDDLARLGRAFNEMAASLERQISQLEELSRVQRRFVSDVSHELRTPLTTIRMAGEVMYEARQDFEPSVSRSAELLQTQLDRFESLLSDLLEVSRFDAGAAQLEVEAADVREVVHRVVEGLRPLADRRGGVVVLEPSRPAVAEIDSRRVERIVRNLVANAIEHGEGRPVQVVVAMDDDAVAVGVRDHGVGLRPGELRMVFNRFWRADPARARTTGGTGLGLAIALEDAHLHGGWLQVWGRPGEGAHFRLTVPRRAGVVLTGSPIDLIPRDAAGPPAPSGPATGAADPAAIDPEPALSLRVPDVAAGPAAP